MKVLVSLSGGLDSLVTLAYYHAVGEDVVAASFDYGSKHAHYELEAGDKIAKHYGVKRYLIDIHDSMRHFRSALLQGPTSIPEGHYNEESMRETVVPARNMIMAAHLAGLADSLKMDQIAFGIHAGDHFIYPDCRPDFWLPMRQAIEKATEMRVSVVTPWITLGKMALIMIGIRYKTPFHLSRTCYKDQPVACGKCGSCQERLEAFANAKIEDPLSYESRILIPRS
jgi:7-cyano-7-deazaguanine synthase